MNLPTRPNSSLDNPDFVHLKSLSDMCKQIILWATAADAQIQVLLAKRAPNMSRRPDESFYMPTPPFPPAPHYPEQSNICDESSLEFGTTSPKAPPMPTVKAELHKLSLSLGIPVALLASKDYLNAGSRPSVEGIRRTQDLINKVLDKIAVGEDPSDLWLK